MIYATKKQGESNERLINRFKQQVQRARVLLKTKQKKYHSAKPTKKYVRASAVMRFMHRSRKAKEQFYS